MKDLFYKTDFGMLGSICMIVCVVGIIVFAILLMALKGKARIIWSGVVLVVIVGCFFTAMNSPKRMVFDPARVDAYAKDHFDTSLVSSETYPLFGQSNPPACLEDEDCEGFVIKHKGTTYWIKYDPKQEAVYLFEPDNKERISEERARMLSESSLESAVKKQSRLTDVSVTVPSGTWVSDLETPQETPVRVSGVLDGVYLKNLLVVVDKNDHVRVIPQGEITKSVSESDLAK